MRLQAILWDLDGTLISTKRLYIEAYARALRPYMKREITEEDVRSVPVVSELRFLQAMAQSDYDACLIDFQRHYAELHDTHFGGIYDGIEATLARLRDLGLKMGIVTGKSRSSYEVTSLTADLGQFDVLVLDDDVDQPKPAPDGILVALRELDVEAARTAYIGDSVNDMLAAHQAGVLAAAALWSKPESERSRFIERVEMKGPVILLATPADVLRLVQAPINRR